VIGITSGGDNSHGLDVHAFSIVGSKGWQHPHPAGENNARLVFWEVTKGCNLRCIHCRATATELSSPTDLPTGTALKIIDQISAAPNPILVLSGGEPLYRSDIF
jgi:MoaA/NifB/PqqE/SkfB family radical SAM enzyme